MDISAWKDQGDKKDEVFCCYAPQDQPLLLKLKKHLVSLEREGLITLWADIDINAGAEWEKELHQHLNKASVILLLISPDFIASDYCYSIEMTRALERHEHKEARIIPVLLRPVAWQKLPFGKLQALPMNAKPVKKWRVQDDAYSDIVEGIRKAIAELHASIAIGKSALTGSAEAYPDESFRKFIDMHRFDAEFQDHLAQVLEHATQRFAADYQDKNIVEALTQDKRLRNIISAENMLQDIIVRPSSFLQSVQTALKQSFKDLLPTLESKRVDQAIYFLLHCIIGELINISNLALSVELSRVPHNLPSQYGTFLGRKIDILGVLEALGSNWPLIAIEGLAGIGKTALAIQVAKYCLVGPNVVLDPPFQFIIWISAKDEPEKKHWLSEVLDTIAMVLNYSSTSRLSKEQMKRKKLEIAQLLGTSRTLLIIDNFETIKDVELEEWIQNLPLSSKVLITSRRNTLTRAYSITLDGLEESAALELISKHAQRLGLHTIKVANKDALLPLVQVTGANPKAIELALGHIKRGLSLKEVIEHLSIASKTTSDVFDNLFIRAWKMMTKHAQYVLQVATFFVDSMSREALEATAGLSKYELDKAVEELVDLMLLKIHEESTISSNRYSIHPLTRAFANAQFQEEQESRKQARVRWSQYYVDFVARNLIRKKPKERYWNSLPSRQRLTLIDPEWGNLKQVLEWADQQQQDELLTHLMVLLVHYMDRSLLNSSRVYYAQRAAQAANRLGWKEDEILFRIDTLGWTLTDERNFVAAEEEIRRGMQIALSLDDENPSSFNLVALGNTFLARMLLEQGEVERASEFMNKIEPTTCSPVIQNRVYMIAGDIAYKMNNILKAIELYEKAILSGQEYGNEGEGFEAYFRLGSVYLENGNLEKAGAYFDKAIVGTEPSNVNIEALYAKYGLARIAETMGERGKAIQLAQEVSESLSQALSSHWLLTQINDFLQSLKE